jgi:2-dehydro-3-deoxyphosphogluconate aldolase/(4S)-4-hydroxy-2-oxoglutarate aldolase
MDIREQIEAAKLVAIVRGDYRESMPVLVEALIAGGIRVIEMTLTSAGAVEAIRMISAEYADRVLIGAGTVLEPTEVEQVAVAGARFVVSPALLPDVIGACGACGLEAIPGVLTPTEIIAAHKSGARLIKIFPVPSPDYLKAVRGPLPQLHLMPTGGIQEDNVRAYLKAGAVALGIGSSLVPSQFDGSVAAAQMLTDRARRFVNLLK